MNTIEIKVTNNINFENKGNPKIVVVGVGGGGNNMISHFARKIKEEKNEINENIKLVAINTDLQALSTMDDKNITLIQIGKETARGLGAGMNPEIGRKSAIENYEDILKALS